MSLEFKFLKGGTLTLWYLLATALLPLILSVCVSLYICTFVSLNDCVYLRVCLMWNRSTQHLSPCGQRTRGWFFLKTSSRGSQQLASSDVPGFETCYIVYTEPPLNLGTPSHYVITNLIPYKALAEVCPSHSQACFGKIRANKRTVCVFCKTVPLGSSGRLPPDNPFLDVITSDPEQHANSLSAQYLPSRFKLMFASSGT